MNGTITVKGCAEMEDLSKRLPKSQSNQWLKVTIPEPLKRCLKNRQFMLAMVLLLPIVFLGLFSGVLPFKDPLASNVSASLQAPSLENLFGTDKMGRDIFSLNLFWCANVSYCWVFSRDYCDGWRYRGWYAFWFFWR